MLTISKFLYYNKKTYLANYIISKVLVVVVYSSFLAKGGNKGKVYIRKRKEKGRRPTKGPKKVFKRA